MCKSIWTTCVVFFVTYSALAQLEKSSISIPPELLENANAVVRNESYHISIEAIDKMVVEREYVVTILNEAGNRHALAFEFYDKSIKVKDQEAIIYNNLGKEIKKYRRSDFQDRSYNQGNLFTDNRVSFVDYHPTSYPYTLVYKSVIQTSETVFVNPWYPIKGYHLSVEESTYKLTNPANIPVRYQQSNFDDYDVISEANTTTLSYRLSNSKALEQESLAPETDFITPKVVVALSQFSLGNVKGSADDWKSFGKWQYDHLVHGLDEIPEATKAHVSSLLAGVTDPKKKAKIIYEYVQSKTRYISIQLGIGGWKPYPANEVDALGYGDCKGLTNYTKALLASQGINSYYTVVYAGEEKKSIDSKFTSMQGNHVILNLPMEGEDIWLECTSQTIPFNFLGDFTDDRDVLVLTPEGGIIKHTPTYDAEKNFLNTTGNCVLSSDGDLQVEATLQSRGIQYDGRMGVEIKKEEEKESYYKSYWNYIDNISLESISLENDKDEIFLTEEVNFSATNYASFAGNDMLVSVNILNRNEFIPKKYKNRTQDFEILRGYTDVDEVVLTLPEGYVISYIPEKKQLDSEFGIYTTEIEQVNARELKFKRKLIINEGLFPSESYRAYRDFRKNIAKFDNQKIVLEKEKS